MLSDEEFYESLDELDDESRRRRERLRDSIPRPGHSRDEVAQWVAKTHQIADVGIREVWYLPTGAPSDEIRLLEVSDRFVGSESKPEAVDFGLDVEGAPYRLSVGDVTTDQLEKIKVDQNLLPLGWSLEGNRIWRRRA